MNALDVLLQSKQQRSTTPHHSQKRRLFLHRPSARRKISGFGEQESGNNALDVLLQSDQRNTTPLKSQKRRRSVENNGNYPSSSESSSSESSSSRFVVCPCCQTSVISHFVNDHVDQCLKGAIPTPLIEQPNSPSGLESGNAELPDQSTLIDFVESVNGAESESLEYTQEVQINIQTDNSIPIGGQECGSDPTTGNQRAILSDDANLEGGKN
eukprot:CAMPEP_0185752444 /NCGR_PEP_ID=MMETSP1174-20130828/11253_1 /TAXON_ID=35687 /ORGANISM="Dictyocha speculum, Strain CCMP1381" /LENGTH=211 /DNA_ID=CAMNT_0028429905 /DNA_START=53 /DNA_END=685 /DNA_ORIENTATION=+